METKDTNDPNSDLLIQELDFSFTRSSGPGGQHANKVSTRVELKFDINKSEVLTEDQKEKIIQTLANRISKEGLLTLSAQEERSQIRNKQLVTARFLRLISEALAPEKKRIETKPPPAAKRTRLDEKKKISEKKQLRKKPGEN